jgi:trans-2,3-dihydro-3-hydroxyanthranilate isomerase
VEPLGGNKAFGGLYGSFARGQAGGGVAGVVITGTPLAPEVMQRVAAEFAAPTTGFLAVSEPAAGATRILGARFFTTRREISACGYVTIALATALADLGVWSGRGDGYQIVAAGGTYDLAFGAPGAGLPRPVRLTVKVLGHEPVADAGLVQQLTGLELHGEYRPEIVSTGLRHLVVPVADAAALRAYVAHRQPAEELGRAFGADTIGLVSLDRGTRIHLRDLCAPIGDLEEPASGTTCAAVADFLYRHGWRPATASGETCVYVITQGDELGRPSVISAEVPAGGDRAVSIAGSARPILTGELHV